MIFESSTSNALKSALPELQKVAPVNSFRTEVLTVEQIDDKNYTFAIEERPIPLKRLGDSIRGATAHWKWSLRNTVSYRACRSTLRINPQVNIYCYRGGIP